MRTLRNMLASAAFAGAGFAGAGVASGHEFWIMPSAFAPDADTLVRVQLFHGERFAGELVGRNTPQIGRYEMLLGDGSTEVRGLHGQTTGLLRPQEPGLGVIVYESEEYVNVLPGPAFEAYLEEEGLGYISAWRRERGESGEEGREAYVRCAKALVEVGGVGGADRQVGLPLEIVVGERSGGRVSATLLFGGSALEGARVVAVSAADPSRLIELESDPAGVVSFEPEGPGPWMLTSLHMVHESEREDVEWKSYWASVTFEAGGGAG